MYYRLAVIMQTGKNSNKQENNLKQEQLQLKYRFIEVDSKKVKNS